MSEKNGNNIDRIRDLIFGNKIKDVETHFNQVNDTLKVLEDKMTKTLNESHAKLQKETEHSLELLEKKIDDLASSSQKEKTKLKELVDTTDESLQEQLNKQKDEFATELKKIKENVADDNKKMADRITAMQREVQATLEKSFSSLSDDKLSRDSMAQILLDVAMKIQGTKIEK